MAAHGASHVRVKVVCNNTGSRLNNSAYLVEEGTQGADADGKLRTHGLDGLTGDAAVDKAFEQAVENLPLLEKLVKAAADKVGGEMMMRPANDENGKATKKLSTAKDKANRDYQGDISRVVDLIGGTCVMPSDGDRRTYKHDGFLLNKVNTLEFVRLLTDCWLFYYN